MEDICNVFIKKYQIFRTYCEVHHSVESTTIMSMNQWCNDIAMWVYVSIAYSATKKEQIFIIIATVTICSCIESADELFQHTLGHECMEDAVNTISIYVYMSIAYSALKKKADFLLAPDTICSCIEAVDELFQYTLGYDRMEHVNTIAIFVCMTIIYSTWKKGDFHYFSCRYYRQLHWSCWRAVPAHLGSWMHGFLCQYYCYVCIYVYCLFCFFKKSRFS